MSGFRKSGNLGQLWIPTNDGSPVLNAPLTPNASFTIMGKTMDSLGSFANRFLSHPLKHWNLGDNITVRPFVRLSGIVGNAQVSPTSAQNSKVDVSAFGIYNDCSGGPSGSATPVAAAPAVALTKAAAGLCWNLIVVDSTGNVSVIKGADNATLNTVFGSAVGNIPYCPVGSFVIDAVQMTAVDKQVVATDILSSTGTIIQEQSGIPNFQIIALKGGILLDAPLPLCHTGAAERVTYAQFMSLDGSLAPVYDTTDWKFDGKTTTTKALAQGDLAAQSIRTEPMTWSGSFSKFHIDMTMAKIAMNVQSGYVKLFPDRNVPGEYFEGAVNWSAFGMGTQVGQVEKDSISFEGNGILESYP